MAVEHRAEYGPRINSLEVREGLIQIPYTENKKSRFVTRGHAVTCYLSETATKALDFPLPPQPRSYKTGPKRNFLIASLAP